MTSWVKKTKPAPRGDDIEACDACGHPADAHDRRAEDQDCAYCLHKGGRCDRTSVAWSSQDRGFFEDPREWSPDLRLSGAVIA